MRYKSQNRDHVGTSWYLTTLRQDGRTLRVGTLSTNDFTGHCFFMLTQVYMLTQVQRVKVNTIVSPFSLPGRVTGPRLLSRREMIDNRTRRVFGGTSNKNSK